MKKVLIIGAAIAAISTFAVSAFAADTSGDTEISENVSGESITAECTQDYCPRNPDRACPNTDCTNESSGNGICDFSCSRYDCQQNMERKSQNRYRQAENNCGNSCDGTQQRIRASWEQ